MRSRSWVAVGVLLMSAAAGRGDDSAFEAASLRAIRFADAKEGWAVGDQGVVWHTIDGGAAWERQPTGSRASLTGLSMLTPYTGYAVGRTQLPGTGGSAGVVLVTTDGGASWTEATQTPLPGLAAVQFLDERTGLVVGDTSAAFPTGAFRTRDGGRTWQALTGPRSEPWQSIAAARGDAAVLGGESGLAFLKGSVLMKCPVPGDAAPDWPALALVGERVLAAGALGRTARIGSANAPAQAGRATPNIDVRAVSVVGEQVWAVGRPGKVVLHSADAGATWKAYPAPLPLPLNAIHMLDANDGWACGDFGTIVRTRDGGKTWALQKSAGQRAAVLFAPARARSVPLGLVARLGHGGYLTTTMTCSAADAPQLAHAVQSVGGTVGEVGYHQRRPAYRDEPTPGRTPESLKALHNPELLERLVLALRMWRPEVVVADAATPDAPNSDCQALLHLREAFTMAADPAAFPDQIRLMGLEPHAAKKLYSLAADGDPAAVELDLAAFDPARGGSLRDAIESATWTLTGRPLPPARVRLRLVAHRLPGAETHADIMQGIDLAAGGTARRVVKPTELTAELMAKCKSDYETRRDLERLADAKGVATGPLIARLQPLPQAVQCRAAIALGYRLAARGEQLAAGDLFAHAAERCGLYPESAEATRWLVASRASGETRRRAELGQFTPAAATLWEPIPADTIQQASHTEAPPPAPAGLRLRDPAAARAWTRGALDLEPRLAAFGGQYLRDPAHQLACASVRRQLGLQADAIGTLKMALAAGHAEPRTDPWQGRFAEELRLLVAEGGEDDGAARGVCRFTKQKPHLDGRLDDDCWQAATPVTLGKWVGERKNGEPAHATQAKFLYDDRYLYVAVNCTHPTAAPTPRATTRGYDADLSGRDRVEILLDLDRDGGSYYRLRVDASGRVADDCTGDATWNPRWFVAGDSTATGWTAELAIPLAELTGSLARDAVWSLNVVRVVPGVGVGSWSPVADCVPDPARMGQLRFVGKPDPNAPQAAPGSAPGLLPNVGAKP